MRERKTHRREAVRLWLCPNCGQTLFSPCPPDLCDFCADYTTWRAHTFAAPDQAGGYVQLPLPLVYDDDEG